MKDIVNFVRHDGNTVQINGESYMFRTGIQSNKCIIKDKILKKFIGRKEIKPNAEKLADFVITEIENVLDGW